MKKFLQSHAGTFQLVFVVGVVGAAVLLSYLLRPDERPTSGGAPSQQTPVTVLVPLASPYENHVSLSGAVAARTITSLVPQVTGRVIEVTPQFRPGAAVAKGQTLFVIDPSDYELAVQRTLADIEVARSDLTRLEAESEAERKLWRDNYSDRPIPDLIARVPQIAAAKARIKAGEAARQAARLDLERTVVRAPFDARVLETQLDVGQVVSGTVAVGSIFSVESLEIAVPVSTDELELIGNPEGRSAVIESRLAGDTVLTGSVVRSGASLDERTRLGTLYVTSDDVRKLTLGEFVTVRITGRSTPAALRIPPAALTSRDRVWVVDDGLIASRKVDVLGREGEMLVVGDFDYADGLVTVPPAGARSGLPVVASVIKPPAQIAGQPDAGD